MKRIARAWSYRLHRLAALDRRSFMLLVRAQGMLVWAWWQVRRRPVGGLVEIVAPAAERTDGVVKEGSDALQRAVGRASRHGLFRPSCLVRALALCRMLESAGHRGAVVRVGVRKEGDGFAAHAWVELGGVAVGEDPAQVRRYVRLTDARLAALR